MALPTNIRLEQTDLPRNFLAFLATKSESFTPLTSDVDIIKLYLLLMLQAHKLEQAIPGTILYGWPSQIFSSVPKPAQVEHLPMACVIKLSTTILNFVL
jgi:hypothetical protein